MVMPADISKRAVEVHRRAFVFDAHADTLTQMTDLEYDLDNPEGVGHLDFLRVSDGVLDAQVFTCFVHPDYLPDRGADRVRQMLSTMDRQVERFPNRLALCTRPGQIAKARQDGRFAAVLAIEGGHAIENSLSVLAEFASRGVRSMTLTWNNSNEWADGCGEEGPHGGLTNRGREVVAAMEEHGLIADISHVSRSTFDDVCAIARQPLLASHSCSRVLREHPRNLDDDQLRVIADSGGVACVNFYPSFLTEVEHATLDDVLDHVERFISVAGADHVGLGTDYDGIPTTPEGLEDVSALPRVTDGLLERGHSSEVVEQILGGNLLRLFDGDLTTEAPPSQEAQSPAMRGTHPAPNQPS